MSNLLKIIRIILILLSIPGIFFVLFAGASVINLVWAEFFPDPSDIAHGMTMLGFVPMIVWSILGLIYLFFLKILWLLSKKVFTPQTLE